MNEICDRCGFENDPFRDVRFWAGNWEAPAGADVDTYNLICDDCHADLERN
ncbi:hypothetical protein [Natrinema sp. DC36]|uniref:hypothetical protein n=1 Tax=Natrinema sp. DC36 TaxID=2878680 RepID=UPI001CEFE762|nr:hypothetical protein [Natrinema sp. DC36]